MESRPHYLSGDLYGTQKDGETKTRVLKDRVFPERVKGMDGKWTDLG